MAIMYIPNRHRIYQPFPFHGPPKFTQIVVFGLKIPMPSGNPGGNYLAIISTYCKA
jgi:hypothetical protein